MKDIYELLNDVDENEVWKEDIERVDLSEIEKKRIYKKLTSHKGPRSGKLQKSPIRKIAVAIISVICLAGVGATATAAVYSYINGNTKEDYKEEVNIVLEKEETMAVDEETVVQEDLVKESIQSFNEDQVKIQVKDVSRSGNEVRISVELNFLEDIPSIAREKMENWISEGRGIFESLLLKNSRFYIDDVDMVYMEWDHEHNRWYSWFAYFISDLARLEGNTLSFDIVTSFKSIEKVYDFHFVFKDFDMGNYVIEGEWVFDYTLEPDVYDEELVKESIYLRGTSEYGYELTLTEYAVTPNGLKLFGTNAVNAENPYMGANSNETCNLRILLEDDLGNYYLMYAGGVGDNREEFVSENGLKMEKGTVILNLYTGVNAEFATDRTYLLEWHPDATSVTITIEEERDIWNEDGVFDHTEYKFVSDSITIPIK